MKIKPVYALYLVIAFLLVVVGIKVNDYLQRDFARWEAEVAAKTDSLAALRKRISEDSVRIVESEAELDAVRDSAREAIGVADSVASDAVSEAERLYKELVAQSPPELTPVFEAWRDSWLTALRAKDEIIAEQERIIVAQDSTLEQYREINADLHEALRRSEELTEFWKEKSHRSWYEKWQVVAPVTAGLTLAGVALISTAVPD